MVTPVTPALCRIELRSEMRDRCQPANPNFLSLQLRQLLDCRLRVHGCRKDSQPTDEILSIQRVIHIACKDRFQAAKFANGIASAFDLAFLLIAAVPRYPHSGFSDY